MYRAERAAQLLLTAIVLSGCPRAAPVGFAEPPEDGVEIRCPVTGDRCPKDPATPSAVFANRTYYFCTPEAHARFLEAPARHADR
ncbi:MAG: hypothetical protein IT384_01800 [Deltaproteobacteria bacterium]|nr:hypothetical protein [Deltaproteobacteria bacterium]